MLVQINSTRWGSWRSDILNTLRSKVHSDNKANTLETIPTLSRGRGCCTGHTRAPGKVPIRKLITLVLILYLWFMLLTTDLTLAFHYFWFVEMRVTCHWCGRNQPRRKPVWSCVSDCTLTKEEYMHVCLSYIQYIFCLKTKWLLQYVQRRLRLSVQTKISQLQDELNPIELGA